MKRILIIALLASTMARAQTVTHLDDYTMGRIDSVVNSQMSLNGMPSVNIGIVYSGRVAYTKAYGIAAPGVNATTSTKYPIASISKTITGMMAMKMIASGDLGLNTLIKNYISGYSTSTITVRHLLCHQSGIGHYSNCPGGYNGVFNSALSQTVVAGCSKCMTPPGSGELYTTFGSTLLGCIIDVRGNSVYSKGYIQLYQDWIRSPGGLTNLTAEYDNSASNLATPYSSPGIPNNSNWSDIGWKLPAGGFVGTAYALAGYGAGVVNYTFLDSVTSNNTMWQLQTTSGTPTNNCADGLTSGFGLAFKVGGSGSNLVISHNGANDHGYCSDLVLYPPKKAGVVSLTNLDNANGFLNNIRAAIDNEYVLCPARRDFTSLVNWTGNWVFESSSVINASNGYTTSAANGSLILDAASVVTLKPGFYASSGTFFRAVIEGCGGTVKPY